MATNYQLLESVLGENRLKYSHDLSEHLRVGGVAEAFFIAADTRELLKAVEVCRELKIGFLIIGQGTKVAVAEDGFKGLVIKNRSDKLKIFGIKGRVSKEGIGVEEALIEAESGVSLNSLVEFASRQGLGGLEDLNECVGTVGGTISVNPTMREKSTQVKVLNDVGDIEEKDVFELERGDIIISVIFKLKSKNFGRT